MALPPSIYAPVSGGLEPTEWPECKTEECARLTRSRSAARVERNYQRVDDINSAFRLHIHTHHLRGPEQWTSF
ncbi:hypothetical protein AMK15_01765 [Streptomyces sp. MJM1172]|nr:hypothetical protein AMK15_01765 [Streptomyces sp. MJM1172]